MNRYHFDLDKALTAWRRSLEYNRPFSADDLDELEQHLRDQVAGSVAEGLSQKAAFERALREMGDHASAESEYRKVYWGKLRRRHQLLHELQWRLSMLKNYLVIAARTLRRQKGYAFINIFGLAVGLACFIMILLFVQHELSYDRFHEKADRIYRVYQRRPAQALFGSDYWATTSPAMAASLAREFPEVEVGTTVGRTYNPLLSFGEERYQEEGIWADNRFLDVFTFPLLKGDTKKALAEPNSIVLTEILARKIFGERDPIGQTLLYQNKDAFTVTGVMADLPETSHLQFEYILTVQSNNSYLNGLKEREWFNNAWFTYVLLNEGSDAQQLEAKMRAYVDVQLADRPSDDRLVFLFQPVTDIHLHSQHISVGQGTVGDIKYVYLFSAIGFLILLLACVNYTNLAVARSIRRAREVGMRKVVGAVRGQLLGQFLGESVLMTFLGLVLALGLAHLLLPLFAHLMDRPIRMDYMGNGLLLPGLLALVVLVGMLSGSYPAFVMTSLRPIQVLAGKADGRGGRFRVQRLLIVSQFAVSIALVTATFVIYEQLQYVQHKELGYDREHILTVRVNDQALTRNYAAIREAWLRDPRVVSVTASGDLPTNITNFQVIGGSAGSGKEDRMTLYHTNVDHEFLDVFGIKLVAGRSFSRAFATDTLGASLINETAARAFGWRPEEAIGKQFDFQDGNGYRTIIGVVKDFHFQSLNFAIGPLMLRLEREWFGHISAKVRPDDLRSTIARFQETVGQFTPYPFEYQFLDELFDRVHKEEVRLGGTFGFFTILALLIASMGMFGLAAFAAEQRTKEIGIRKMLGATVSGLVAMLVKNFLGLVGVAFVVAAPLAYFAMDHWLEDFAYRIELSPGIFLLPGVLALVIALLTVSYQGVRAATADPVKSLRYE